MPRAATIESLPEAFAMVKAMQAEVVGHFHRAVTTLSMAGLDPAIQPLSAVGS